MKEVIKSTGITLTIDIIINISGCWEYGSVGRVLAYCAESHGLYPQHAINQMWYMPITPALRK